MQLIVIVAKELARDQDVMKKYSVMLLIVLYSAFYSHGWTGQTASTHICAQELLTALMHKGALQHVKTQQYS
jgi:hypothetical protein